MRLDSVSNISNLQRASTLAHSGFAYSKFSSSVGEEEPDDSKKPKQPNKSSLPSEATKDNATADNAEVITYLSLDDIRAGRFGPVKENLWQTEHILISLMNNTYSVGRGVIRKAWKWASMYLVEEAPKTRPLPFACDLMLPTCSQNNPTMAFSVGKLFNDYRIYDPYADVRAPKERKPEKIKSKDRFKFSPRKQEGLLALLSMFPLTQYPGVTDNRLTESESKYVENWGKVVNAQMARFNEFPKGNPLLPTTINYKRSLSTILLSDESKDSYKRLSDLINTVGPCIIKRPLTVLQSIPALKKALGELVDNGAFHSENHENIIEQMNRMSANVSLAIEKLQNKVSVVKKRRSQFLAGIHSPKSDETPADSAGDRTVPIKTLSANERNKVLIYNRRIRRNERRCRRANLALGAVYSLVAQKRGSTEYRETGYE